MSKRRSRQKRSNTVAKATLAVVLLLTIGGVLWLISGDIWSDIKSAVLPKKSEKEQTPKLTLANNSADTAVLFLTDKQFLLKKPAQAKPKYKNFYGITWRGDVHENLAFARQMKYDYVFYQNGMEGDPLSNGLYFYLETPEYLVYNKKVSVRKSHSDKEVNFYTSHCVLKDNRSSFPFNLATGWYSDRHTFTPLLDFQQQKIIDWAVDSILNRIKKIEARNPNFHFGGFAWDEPRINGDFWEGLPPNREAVTLSKWRGTDDGALAPGATHEYKTYSEGHIAFYKQLVQKAKSRYPAVRTMYEPFKVYEDWIKDATRYPNPKSFSPDILCQEGGTLAFVTDKRIYKDGLVTKDNIYCTTPDVFSEDGNRTLAAAAAINGAGFGWYGRFGGTGKMPNFMNVSELPARLKLIRCLTNWEDANGVPLSKRKWINEVYSSPCAYVSPDVIALLQPETKKVFVVFLTLQGRFKLPPDTRIKSVFETNNLLIEDKTSTDDLLQNDGNVRPRLAMNLEKCYILQFN